MARPTKFQGKYCEQAKKLAILGATDKDLADFFGVTEQTINNWKHDFPQFFESLKAGKKEADAKVVKALFQRATGYSHPEDKIFNAGGEPMIVPTTKEYPPETTACIFWLKNRQPDLWRDKQDHEITGKNGGPIETQDMTEIESARLIAYALEKGKRAMEESEACH